MVQCSPFASQWSIPRQSHVGAIVGGVAGGVVGVIAISAGLFFLLRSRSKSRQSQDEKHSLDLLQGSNAVYHDPRLPEASQVEPFLFPGSNSPPPSLAGTSEPYYPRHTQDSLPSSVTSPPPSSRKSPGMPRSRPADIIVQHDDAGPSEDPDMSESAASDTPRIIDLPPPYANLKPRSPPRPLPTPGTVVGRGETDASSDSSP